MGDVTEMKSRKTVAYRKRGAKRGNGRTLEDAMRQAH